MRVVELSKSGVQKIYSHRYELKATDLVSSLKSFQPGEWVYFLEQNQNLTKHHIGYINPFADIFCGHVVPLKDEELPSCAPSRTNKVLDEDLIQQIMIKKLKIAYFKRQLFKGYENSSRIFYGISDGLSGLIIDQFENATIIQINTAGLDHFRNVIRSFVEDLTGKKSYFLDHAMYRKREGLPVFKEESYPSLIAKENDLTFEVRSSVLQKVGFYYDHRENRWQLQNFLKRIQLDFKKGLDLFCYVGAWGVSALFAHEDLTVDFVDQGDFDQDIQKNLELNGFGGKGTFYRQDVFKFLDEAYTRNDSYDVIMCDPPAFAKSSKVKNQALDGYLKLHRKVFKISSKRSLIVFSSCTHYVSDKEFQDNVFKASVLEKRTVQLLHSGIQGFDHPMTNQNHQSNYIKSHFYYVES